MRYIPNTDADRLEMLKAIDRSSIDELFDDIPKAVRDKFEPLGRNGLSEFETVVRLERLGAANRAHDRVLFLGGGIYDHYVPSIVSHVLGRSEFYTSYTPYQPEISQGTLTAMFEFQTMVCELTGMEVANASMYDGATALAEAALMADRIRRGGTIVVARSIQAHARRVLETYCWAAGIDIVEWPYDGSGRCDISSLPDNVSAVILQTPNAFGVTEKLHGIKEQIGDALLIVSVYPLSLGLLEPPGAYGADIVVGEGQSLGLPMGFGGPLLGLFATRRAFLRQMPGRAAGRTTDVEGKVGYVMAAQTREQHIRRERATSNICTNSALCALAATVYLASVGADGLRQVAELNLEKAHYLADRLCQLDGVEMIFDAPYFNEFVVRVPEDADVVRHRLAAEGFLVDRPSELPVPEAKKALRFAVTEKRTKDEMDRVVELIGGGR